MFTQFLGTAATVYTVGLLCAGLTLAVALSLRGSPVRPATWNSRS